MALAALLCFCCLSSKLAFIIHLPQAFNQLLVEKLHCLTLVLGDLGPPLSRL
jgi:hypothetical protein